jgi:hypothetical protein
MTATRPVGSVRRLVTALVQSKSKLVLVARHSVRSSPSIGVELRSSRRVGRVLDSSVDSGRRWHLRLRHHPESSPSTLDAAAIPCGGQGRADVESEPHAVSKALGAPLSGSLQDGHKLFEKLLLWPTATTTASVNRPSYG